MAVYTPKQFVKQVSSIRSSFSSQIQDALEYSLMIANEQFDENFDNEGFTDMHHQPWNTNHPQTIKDKGHDTILKGKTGKLRRSQDNRLFRTGGYRAARVFYKVIGKDGKDYAHKMNFGFINQNGSYVPKRKFIGRSKKLDARVRSVFVSAVKKAFNTNYTICR